MPQDTRTPAERKEELKPDPRSPAEKLRFKWMLQNVNMLYLGMRVLLLMDISFLSRFWTQVPPSPPLRLLTARPPHRPPQPAQRAAWAVPSRRRWRFFCWRCRSGTVWVMVMLCHGTRRSLK